MPMKAWWLSYIVQKIETADNSEMPKWEKCNNIHGHMKFTAGDAQTRNASTVACLSIASLVKPSKKHKEEWECVHVHYSFHLRP